MIKSNDHMFSHQNQIWLLLLCHIRKYLLWTNLQWTGTNQNAIENAMHDVFA